MKLSPPRRATLLSGAVWQGMETAATRKLRAPKGTRLSQGDEQFCQSGKGDPKSLGPLHWVVCK